jgi:IclR family KDG regulon transcriptional repressor
MTNSSIRSAKRISRVLEDVKRPISLKEVAKKCDYPVSSAAALLKSMAMLGYVFHDGYHRTYMPAMRIAQIGR